ncbi:MAG: selenocysteine-specific translation elongation factor [Nitrospiraceae bacterium]|nr:selenocysteine-specific translation elongation factor [Nitrospiraceae bacterium]
MHYVILGTAGHIDHGKSALVKALTGTDPDRLKEEKERGITIDLGFADLKYPDGLTVGIIDVPGHEKLVRNMLAGAGGIDIVLLVIAADEGIMPQTREHLAICNLLNIKSGLIVLTKTDLVEDDWIRLISEEIKTFVKDTFLEGTDIIPVSAKTGENLELLKEKIKEIGLKVSPKLTNSIFRLPIDRVFTLKGFGTVITGTAVSGSISVDDEVQILPTNIKSKVRGLHSHGAALKTSYAGQRTAINLSGVDKETLSRGDVVITPDKIFPTKLIDAKINLLGKTPSLKTKSLVHFHTGTSEIIARIIMYDRDELKQGESCFCQFRLKEPVICMCGDRYIIRRFSPVETIGGGEILDPYPIKRKKSEGIEDLDVFEKGSLDEKIEAKLKKAGIHGILSASIEGWINTDLQKIKDAISLSKEKSLIKQVDNMLIHANEISSVKEKIKKALDQFHKKNPLRQGISKEEVRLQLKVEQKTFNAILSSMPEIAIEKDILRIGSFNVSLSDAEVKTKKKILAALEQSGFQPPSKDELSKNLLLPLKQLDDILKLMTKEKSVVRINDSFYITADAYNKMLDALKDFYSKKKEMTLAEFRDILGTTRKYAVPFVEYLDSSKVTLRIGDVRKFLLIKN